MKTKKRKKTEQFGNISNWEEIEDSFFYKHANRVWQKICYIEDEKIGINLAEYYFNGRTTYEVDIQIPEEFSIANKTINITIFSYDKLDFERAEKDALKVMKKLIRNKYLK